MRICEFGKLETVTNNQSSQAKIKKYLFPRYNDAAGLCDLCLLTSQPIYREYFKFSFIDTQSSIE